jgi:hypothetical protein
MLRKVLLPLMANVLLAGPSWGVNEGATIVLHARVMDVNATCTTPQDVNGLDCDEVRPLVNLTTGTNYDIYVYAKNFDAAIRGVQLKFNWPTDWTFMGWFGNCQANNLGAVAPTATERNLAVAFDCNGYGEVLQPIGWLRLHAGASGCLEITSADYPYGTHFLRCTGQTSGIASTHWGRVCIGSGGVDRCDSPPPPGEWDFGIIESE